MKILRLTINNIASIEHADLDFEHGPLTEPIFLIHGPTGAGKSTIINSICLALYATTPALQSAVANRHSDPEERIKNNDPCTMMRRGTKNCYVNLRFEGNDRKIYEAKWECHRSQNKKSRKLIDSRELHDIKAGTTLTKIDEIKQKILQVVGLTFDEFCRTTVLAQGEFTKFIAADDSQKSDILEKLTRTSRFSEIGRRIFSRYQNAKKELELVQATIDGISLLKPEDIERINKLIDDKKADLDKIMALRDNADTLLKWLTEAQALNLERDRCAVALDNALQRRNADDSLAADASIRLWDATTDLRSTIDNINREHKAADIKQRELQGRADAYAEILGALEMLRADRTKNETRRNKYKAEIDMMESLEPLFDSSERISLLANEIQAKKQNLAARHDTIKSIEQDTARQRDNIDKLNATIDKDTQARQTAQEAVNNARSAIGDESIDTLRSNLDNINNDKRRADDCRKAISTFDQCENDLKQVTLKMKDTLNNRETTRTELSDINSKIAAAVVECARLKTIKDAATVMQEHIDELRSAFADTDQCPLCGTKGAHIHPADTVSKYCNEARDRWQKAEDALAALRRSKAETEGRIKAYDTDVAEIDAEIEHRRNACKSALDSALTFAKDLGINITDRKGRMQAINNLCATIDNQLEHARKRYNDAVAADNTLKQAEKQLNAIDERIAQNKAECLKVQQAIVDARGRLTTARTLIDEYNAAISDSLKHLNTLAESMNMPAVNADNARTFATTIATKAAKHKKNKESLEKVEAEILADSSTIDIVTETLKPAHALFKYPSSLPTRSKITDLPTLAVTFIHDVIAINSERQSHLSDAAAAQTAANQYYTSHPEVTPDAVNAIIAIGPDNIDRLRQTAADLDKAVNTARGALGNVDSRIASHAAKRPQENPEATVESQTSLVKNLNNTIEETNKIITGAYKELEIDSQNNIRYADTKDKLALKRKECDNWALLNKTFGGETGQRFRDIAQCRIMKVLLDSANTFMARLTDRYRFAGDSTELTINIIDRYNGETKRSVTSLSGGEMFLASLALALSLASIGNRIKVDTLYIDEGFGSLSGEPLNNVLDTLDKLYQSTGRKVGIITHVDSVKERIPTKILVKPNNSVSTITLESL